MEKPRFTCLVAALVVTLAACGGGSAPPQADVQEAAENTPELDADTDDAGEEPASTDTEPTEPVGEEPIAPRCAVKDGASYLEVACSEAHDAEFAAIVGPPEGTSPTDPDEFAEALQKQCFESVEELTGRPMTRFGIVAGGSTTDQPGATFAADVECWAEATAEGTLAGSLRDITLEEALGDNVLIGDLEPGTCYLFVDEQEDSYDIGRVADCAEPFAEMTLGIAVADVEAYPGDDAVIELGDRLCADVAGAIAFEPIGDVVSYIYPGEFEWNERGIRDFICTSYRSSDFDAAPFCAVNGGGGDFEEVGCDEPHDLEFVGLVAPPAELLPEDYDEAVALLNGACVSLVSEYLGDRDLSRSGVGVYATADAELGGPIVGDVNCFLLVSSAAALSAAVAEVGLDAALGENRIVEELEPGTCFLNPSDSFDLGTVVSCDTPDALMQIGSFTADDRPYPGLDALRQIRGERCPQILVESGLGDVVDVDTLSGVIPGLEGWRDLGRRTITCDAAVLMPSA